VSHSKSNCLKRIFIVVLLNEKGEIVLVLFGIIEEVLEVLSNVILMVGN